MPWISESEPPEKDKMITFDESDDRVLELVPEGDRVLRVASFEIGVQSKGKLAGKQKFEVKFLDEETGATIEEKFFNAENTRWRIKQFLAAAGVAPAYGVPFSFNAVDAKKRGILWLDPEGLRVHAKVWHEPWESDPKKKTARVKLFYTDRTPLRRHVPEQAEQPAADVWED